MKVKSRDIKKKRRGEERKEEDRECKEEEVAWAPAGEDGDTLRAEPLASAPSAGGPPRRSPGRFPKAIARSGAVPMEKAQPNAGGRPGGEPPAWCRVLAWPARAEGYEGRAPGTGGDSCSGPTAPPAPAESFHLPLGAGIIPPGGQREP